MTAALLTATSASDRAAISAMSIAERLDRLALTPLHVAIIALCTLGLAADIGEAAGPPGLTKKPVQ